LRGILEFLEESKIPYSLDHSLFFEGLWYDTAVFEFAYLEPTEEGKASKHILLAEGGRMMRAGEAAYGKRLDVVGGAVFVDRLEQILIDKGKLGLGQKKSEIFFAHLSDAAKKKSLPILEELRQGGMSVEESLGRDSIKSQLHIAERVNAKIALILGQKEALDGTIIVRETESGIQETIPQDRLIEFLKRKLKRP
jgi:histidyl-tRNA synthetase